MKMHPLNAVRATSFVVAVMSSTLTLCQTVANVYVSHVASNALGAPNVVSAWAADSAGRLTAIAGSPFRADAVNMAVNGKYLFANSVDGSSVNTFLMSSSGAELLPSSATRNPTPPTALRCALPRATSTPTRLRA